MAKRFRPLDLSTNFFFNWLTSHTGVVVFESFRKHKKYVLSGSGKSIRSSAHLAEMPVLLSITR